MKNKYFYLLIILQFYSCKTHYPLLDNIEVKISNHKINNCDYFCHYLDFEIINNNDVGVYLPNIWKYFKIINENNKDISGVVEDFEEYNYINNGDYGASKSIDSTNRKDDYHNLIRSNEYEKIKLIIIDEDYKILEREALKNNIKYPEEKINEIKEELFIYKYGNIMYIPPRKSIHINKEVNYLFNNYILKENRLDISGHGEVIKPSDSIPNPFSYLYEDYERKITKKVVVMFDYIANSPFDGGDFIEFPIDFFNVKNKKTVHISKEFPKKILKKYYLITQLKSKDTLTIKIK